MLDDFNPDDLRAVAALIASDGGPEASVDLADLALPGVWVTLAGIDSRFRGATIRAQLWCVVPDDSADTQLDDLAALYNGVKARVRAAGHVEPDGQVQALQVVHPDGHTLPALLFPIRFDTVQP